MTTVRLTCSCGQSWDHPLSEPVPADPQSACPSCTPTQHPAAAAAPTGAAAPPVGPGSAVAGFELLEELSRGGMGVVYKARQVALNRVVALKAIPPAKLSVPGARALFEREVRAAARLNHPNIVTVFHTDLDGPLPYLAMEYVPGTDLLRLVRECGPLPVADAIDYVRQAAEGLQHAHEQGLVHRDLKPSNLIVSPVSGAAGGRRGRVKILDMGLARVVGPDGGEVEPGPTEPGAFLGTPDYAPPEQAEDPRKADARSDLYSLGATLYFLLTGEVPFPGPTLAEKRQRALLEPPPSPAAKRPEVPAPLDELVRRLLARSPADRYQTAAEVAAALDRVARAPRPKPDPVAVTGTRPTETPTMSENFYERERAAVARLADAVRARAAAEAEVAAAFEAATDKAEREVARARKSNATARQSELGRIDETHEQTVAALTRKFDSDQFTADRTRDERHLTTTSKYRDAEKRGRTEYKDRLWHVDSMLEAGEKAAKDQFELLQRKAAGGTEQAAALWNSAAPVLARGRVERSEVEFAGEIPPPGDDDPITRMNKTLQNAAEALDRAAGLWSPRWSRPSGLAGLVAISAALGASSFAFLDPAAAAAAAAAAAVLGVGWWLLARWRARAATLRHGKAMGRHLAEAGRAVRLLNDYAAREYAEQRAQLAERHARKRAETDQHYLPQFAAQKATYESELERIDAEHAVQVEKVARLRRRELDQEQEEYAALRAKFERRLEVELKAAEEVYAEKLAAATAARDAAWSAAASAWMEATGGVAAAFNELRAEGAELFPPWEELASPDRPLAARVPDGVRCGDWKVDLKAIPDGVPADPRLAPPPDLSGDVPAFLPFPDRCSALLRVRDEGRAAGVNVLQSMMLRFLTGLPPGKVRFTIIDPVGLGDNFAAFMHLADYDEKLVTSQIWTEGPHIEQRLTDLTDHIASVIQKYLRNQYRTIEEYNRAAGEVAEPYRVLVVANFPTNFTPEAAKRLVSIANSGPSCGVCTLVTADTRAAMPRDFKIEDLEAASFTLAWKDGAFVSKDPVLSAFPLALDRPPDGAVLSGLVQRVGRGSKDAARVEVPFDYIAPKPDALWRSDAAKGFEVPIGRAGATRRQVFALGRGTAQHALVAGKTGSGKSTLLHALITNLAMMYSPDEAELYLIDFKEGVEFQWYATYRLPHARVVAIQSEREFGLSVLQRLDGILRERGEKFREAGVNDLAGYRAARPDEKTPRILLVIDEFQQLFVEDDKLAQEASLLLDRLVRQGRAFGMHVLLGSQTLGGSYSLPRSTIDQMAVRVALQCSDTDAQLILSKDNTAARLLSRPGEALYNDQNGLVEGNDPFQVVWLSEEKREQLLEDLHARAGERWPPPLVFAGNNPADIENNRALANLLEAPAAAKAPAAWLGDPIAIKEPTAAVFRASGGSNLLVLGQNEQGARGLFAAAAVALAAQVNAPAGATAFTLLDATPDDAEDAEFFAKFAAKLPGAAAPPRSALREALAELAAEIDRRQKGESADRSPRFLMVFGLHRFRDLRKSDDDFGFGRRGAEKVASPAELLNTILREGPPLGVFVIAWCDSLTNLNRAFDRPQLREFGMRVLFQMSAADSSTLMDTPAASRLKRHQAILLLEDQERAEKFRPYGLPPAAWLDAACEKLRSRAGLDAQPSGV
ncbi:MAG TPA: FtsK/SpoIIIE domain-containing protein [Gemmata sp.]|nr:FtsK/SpoIIIE domain-containing protein [Gemmata sp.]